MNKANRQTALPARNSSSEGAMDQDHTHQASERVSPEEEVPLNSTTGGSGGLPSLNAAQHNSIFLDGPSRGSPYHYRPLNPGQICLLRLEPGYWPPLSCQITHEILSELGRIGREYEAVSYVRGSGVQSPCLARPHG